MRKHSAGPGVGRRRRSSGLTMPAWLVRDGWAPAGSPTPPHQTCLAHLLRRARDLARDHPRAPVRRPDRHGSRILPAGARHLINTCDRRVAGVISPHGAAETARGRDVLTHLFTALDHVGDPAPTCSRSGRRPSEHRAMTGKLLQLSRDPVTVDATNWRAGTPCVRPVVNRKVCGGNRSPLSAPTPNKCSPACCAPSNAARRVRDALRGRTPSRAPAHRLPKPSLLRVREPSPRSSYSEPCRQLSLRQSP